ncbi:MAG: hydroxyacylglutathione hydrolase [Dinoroseobacter sp.]|nr:hydroxyacylglutathione hydrolase [Dinoroseobacter sp.]
MTLEVYQYPYGPGANYGVLLHDPVAKETASVDAGDGAALMAALEKTGWPLTEIWVTHHHHDHVDGLEEVKAATGCTVRGPAPESQPIAGLDLRHGDGDSFVFAGHSVHVIHTPGHTTDMINYYLPSERLVFTGDTLFVMGCGRLFEGDGPMMHASLQKLVALPEDTVVYCSHEYTEANADFALTVDPNNTALRERATAVKALRAEGKPTVPTTLADELATNPFLRANDPAIRAHLGLEDASDAEVFTEIRRRKDAA